MEIGENKSFTIEADSFNISLASSYHLSIQIGITHLSYSLLNINTLNYEYVKNYNISSSEETAIEISEIITNDSILRNQFSSQSIAFVNFPSTLVPNNIYKKEDAKTFLSFNTEIKGKVITDTILSKKVNLIYCVPKNLLEITKNFFPNAKQKSQESILIEQYNNLNDNTNTAYIYLNENKLLITIFKHKELVFNNTFEYKTKEDILYFTLFTLEQLKLSTEEIKVIVFGTIEKDDPYFNLLYDYIRNIKLGERPREFTFPNAFNTISSHRYFGLFTQVLCV